MEPERYQARFYDNESEVAEAQRKSGLDRNQVFLTTKIKSDEHGTHAAKEALHDSLSKTSLDYWDLVLLHDPKAGKKKRIEAYAVLFEAQKAGQIREIGVSNFGVKHLEELRAEKLPSPAVDQVELHPWCQQKAIVEYCQKHGIQVQAFCPLVRGKKMKDPTLQYISAALNKYPGQVLIRWSLQKGFVPLPKSDSAARIKSNADVFDFEIPVEMMDKLDALDEGNGGSVSWNPTNED
ncbi:hypothetical protein EMMF5_003731 [Cystobasidiomycetes sp. EMM_F5]